MFFVICNIIILQKINFCLRCFLIIRVSAIKQKLTGAIAADAVLTDALAQVNLAHNALGTVGDQAQGLAPVDAAQDARDAQRSANHAADDAHLVFIFFYFLRMFYSFLNFQFFENHSERFRKSIVAERSHFSSL